MVNQLQSQIAQLQHELSEARRDIEGRLEKLAEGNNDAAQRENVDKLKQAGDDAAKQIDQLKAVSIWNLADPGLKTRNSK